MRHNGRIARISARAEVSPPGMAAILLFIGGGWLWVDFVAPLVSRQRKG
jgi:hypothetical protein